MLPPLEKFAAGPSKDSNMTLHYVAYFHSLLQNTGASKLELVRDDAIVSDVLEEANRLLRSIPPATIAVESDGIPSRPCRKPSAENLLQLLSHQASSSTYTEEKDESGEDNECSQRLPQRGMGMKAWDSEKANRTSLSFFLGEAESTGVDGRVIPPSPIRTQGKGFTPRNATTNKRKPCRWSASAIPTTAGKIS